MRGVGPNVALNAAPFCDRGHIQTLREREKTASHLASHFPAIFQPLSSPDKPPKILRKPARPAPYRATAIYRPYRRSSSRKNQVIAKVSR
jgi:hypothetical protein